MAEIEASLLAKVRSAASSYDRPVLIGFLKGRKKRVGTLIEAASNQSLKELKREIKKKGGKKLKVYKEISTIYAEMPVDKVEDLASVSCAQKVYDAEGDVKLSLHESVPLVMGVEKWQLPYRVKRKKLEGQGVKVAVIDSGIDNDHPDFGWLGLRIESVKNFSGGRKYKGTEHGTHVAGIIAGSGRASGYRYVGVAPKAKLYIAKVFINSGTPTTRDTIIDATLWAIKKKVDVINMSFGDNHGCSDGTCPLCKIADYASCQGITVVAAAGNAGPADRTISCPGNAQQAITVGATTKIPPIVVTGYSGRGTTKYPGKPDLVAPGENIMAPQPGGQYDKMSGTSMATPHVTGLAALLYQMKRFSWSNRKKKIAPIEIKQTLKRTCVDIGEHPTAQGNGLVKFSHSLVNVQQSDKKPTWFGGPRPPKKKKEKHLISLTEQSLIKLKEEGVPEYILARLEELKNQIYASEKEFIRALKKKIGRKQTSHYKTLILRYAEKSLQSPEGILQDKQEAKDLSTCLAAMKMFCPHYNKEICNEVYENCIHYQSVSQIEVLKKVKL